MKRTLSFLLSILMVFSVFTVLAGAIDEKSNYTYETLTDGTIRIKKYTGSEINVVIPEKIDEKKVSEIGNCSFINKKKIKTIKIPNGVKGIGDFSFKDNVSLESIEIPESVTEIGAQAFSGCKELKSVKLPSKLKTISRYLFSCSGITEIEIPEGVTTIKTSPFYGTKISEIKLPKNLKTLENSALAGLDIFEIVIPNSVTMIEYNTFENCKKLKSVTLPEGLKTIGSEAFNNCTALEKINFPKSLSTIGASAFKNCSSLTEISIPSKVTIGSRAFMNCTALKKIKLSSKANYILSQAFDGTAYFSDQKNWTGKALYLGTYLIGLKKDISGNFKIKNGTTAVAQYVFSNCKNLTGVSVPESVVNFGFSVMYISDVFFEGCRSLTKINVAKENKKFSSVGGVLFNKSQKQLLLYPASKPGKVYNVPKTVKEIVSHAFNGCRYLTTVNFDENSKLRIRGQGFYNCLKIKTMRIPKNVKVDWDNYPPIGTRPYKPGGKEAYKKVDGFTVIGYRNSSAYYLCRAYGIPFVAICKDGTTNHPYKSYKAKKATYFSKGHSAYKYCPVCKDVVGYSVYDMLYLDTPLITVAGGKGKIAVKYDEAVKDATGFQVRYFDSKGNAVTKNFKTTKAMTVAFKNVPAGDYKVFVRAFIIEGKNVAFSSWNGRKITVK